MRREKLMTQPKQLAKNNRSIAGKLNVAADQMSVRRRPLASKLLRTVAFAGIVSVSALSPSARSSNVFAGTACDAYIPECGEGICDCGGCDAPSGSTCDCGSQKGLKNNPIFKSLDLVAGGIEKVLGLDRCGTAGCGKSGCDSCGCDSFDGTSYNVTPLAPHLHNHAEPLNATPTPAPPMQSTPRSMMPRTVTPPTALPGLPSVPPLETTPRRFEPRDIQPRNVQPRTSEPREVQPRSVAPRMSEPRLVDPTPAPPSEVQPQTAPRTLRRIPEPEAPNETPAMPLPNTDLGSPTSDPFGADAFPAAPTPVPEPDNDGGSIFDALENDDPFMDDEVRLRQPYQSVRPTGLKRYQPIRRTSRPAEPRQTSTLRQAQPVVGSGLRPVSHNEPVELAPLGGSRKLTPYRASR